MAFDPGVISAADAGLDEGAVDRLVAKFGSLIDKGRMPGAVMLLVRGGAVACFRSLGRLGPASDAPMPLDAIFRIYSMTKPIVSVAVMRLFEHGELRLDDTVSKFLPEFASTRVGVERNGKLELVEQARAMTVQDLLRHTAGLTYEFFPPSPVRQAYLDANLFSPGRTNADLSAALAALPLAHQPGSAFEYSRATDVLGHVIEVISGQTLGNHLREVLFEPLGMTDTGFSVPPDQQHRIAEPFPTDPDTGAAVALGNPRRAPTLESGGGGLLSTAVDYGRFLQMLLNGGRLDDLASFADGSVAAERAGSGVGSAVDKSVRILGRKTVELMTADHLGSIPGTLGILPPGYGFGLGVAVRLVAGVASDPGSVGTYGWSGASGTMFFVDPQEDFFGVMLAQAPGQAGELRELFRNIACAAVD